MLLFFVSASNNAVDLLHGIGRGKAAHTKMGEIMGKNLKNKVAVVSGATSGIGKAIAQKLQARGVKIVNVSKDETELKYYKNYVCNIADTAELHGVCKDIEQTVGEIDFLFCNAGLGIGGSMENARLENVRTLFDVNVIAQAQMTTLLIPLVKNGGKIIYTASMAALLPLPYQACYSASKAALDNFARALATELKPRNIGVCAILPGDIATGFTAARMVSTGQSAREKHSVDKATKAELSGKSPEIVANAALRIVTKRRTPLRVVVGCGNKLLAFAIRFMPLKLINFLIDKIYL